MLTSGNAIIAAQVGIAGSANIGDYVKIGGQADFTHLFIGNNVTIAGKSGEQKMSDNKVVAGFPTKDINDWKREIIKNKNDIFKNDIEKLILTERLFYF